MHHGDLLKKNIKLIHFGFQLNFSFPVNFFVYAVFIVLFCEQLITIALSVSYAAYDMLDFGFHSVIPYSAYVQPYNMLHMNPLHGIHE